MKSILLGMALICSPHNATKFESLKTLTLYKVPPAGIESNGNDGGCTILYWPPVDIPSNGNDEGGCTIS